MPAASPISPAQAGSIAARGRKLLRQGRISHRQAVLLDCLLWSVRRPGAGAVAASYAVLSRLAHISRETVADGVRRLAALGLVSIVKRRVRCAWIGGGTASRQASNAYVLHAGNTEFAPATVIQEIALSLPLPIAAAEARAALESIRRRRAGVIADLLRRGAAPA
jgi:hypothetical protein